MRIENMHLPMRYDYSHCVPLSNMSFNLHHSFVVVEPFPRAFLVHFSFSIVHNRFSIVEIHSACSIE
jgi:hypothetical protein